MSEILGDITFTGIDSVCGSYCEKLFFMLKEKSGDRIKNILDSLRSSKADRERIAGYKDIYDSEKTEDVCHLAAKYGYFYEEYLKAFGGYEKAESIFSDKNIPKNLKELAIDGKELLTLGFLGKELGDVLSKLLYDAICKNVQNTKQALFERAKQYREEV